VIVYKTTNLLNGKIYVGSDKNNNPEYLGSGKLLKQAILKHGKSNFVKEILCTCENLEDLKEKESFWIVSLNSNKRDVGYNISPSYFGGDTFSTNPNKEKTRIKISKNTTGKNNPMYKRSVFDCWVEKYGIKGALARQVDQAKKISSSLKGKNKKPVYEIWKEKFGIEKANELNYELKEKRKTNAIIKNANAKIVLIYKLGELLHVFSQTKIAAKFYNRSPDFFIKNHARVCKENDLDRIEFLKSSEISESQKLTILQISRIQ
jgi:group I intron endonuclease